MTAAHTCQACSLLADASIRDQLALVTAPTVSATQLVAYISYLNFKGPLLCLKAGHVRHTHSPKIMPLLVAFKGASSGEHER